MKPYFWYSKPISKQKSTQITGGGGTCIVQLFIWMAFLCVPLSSHPLIDLQQFVGRSAQNQLQNRRIVIIIVFNCYFALL